jgi:hypothetical protein
VTSDPKKMGMIVSKSFGMFDKDKSGFIEAAEARNAAQQVRVCALLQLACCSVWCSGSDTV